MCLYNCKPVKLRKDRIVYVVRRHTEGAITSPFQSNFEWEVGVTYIQEPPKNKLIREGVAIDKGFFHSFKLLENAKRLVADSGYSGDNDYVVIYKAIIPHKSVLMQGRIDNMTKGSIGGHKNISYASNKLRLIERLRLKESTINN